MTEIPDIQRSRPAPVLPRRRPVNFWHAIVFLAFIGVAGTLIVIGAVAFVGGFAG